MSDSTPHPSNSRNKKRSKKHLLIRFLSLLLRHLSSCPSKPRTKAGETLDHYPSPEREEDMVAEEKGGEEEEEEAAAAMRKSVKKLHFGGREEKEEAVVEIKKLARGDPCTRRVLAKLGVIPSLVAMVVEAEEDDRRRVAVEALIEMANGTYTNKVLMVEAGLLAKLPQLMGTENTSRKKELALLLLSISSLAKTQFPMAARHLVPLLIDMLDATADEISDDVKVTCLATLYNLSTKLENSKDIISSGAVHSLLTLALNKRASEGALATLGNLVPTAAGKKAIEDDPSVPKVLIDIIAWDDKPKCQELAVYVLMVLANGSKTQRQRMAGLGAVPLLLEVALLGSALAQKRALKLLQWFKAEGQTKMGAHSGPQAERAALASSSVDGVEIKGCRREIKRMVKQSLDKNMEVIIRRANASEDFSNIKALGVSSSSKSLPY